MKYISMKKILALFTIITSFFLYTQGALATEYTVTYTATDSSLNPGTATRTVTVSAAAVETPPVEETPPDESTPPEEDETDILDSYPSTEWTQLTHPNADTVIVVKKNGRVVKLLNTATDEVIKSIKTNKKAQQVVRTKRQKLFKKNTLVFASLNRKSKSVQLQLFRLTSDSITRTARTKITQWSGKNFKLQVKAKAKRIILSKGKNQVTQAVSKKLKLRSVE